MKRLMKVVLLSSVLGIVLAPSPARADGFFVPWAGVNFDNDPADGRGSYGFSAGYMGAGVFGTEFDFGYSPRFFGDDEFFGSNNVLTAMGNLILGIPIGGTTGGGFRPYFTGGVGLIRTDIDGLFEDDAIAENDFGWNAGGGFMAYFGDHVGIRGDLRYFRNFSDSSDVGFDNFDLDVGTLKFWRASIGLVLR